MKVLVIEDSPQFQMVAETAIQPVAQVIKAHNLREAREALKEHNPQLILLDVSLPDGDGFTFCTEIKSLEQFANTPVFFMTGLQETMSKVMAFNMGADDYITKPFDPLELRARVEAKLKKVSSDKKNEVVMGPLKISYSKQTVELKDSADQWQRVDLTHTEFKLLILFVEHPEVVYSRTQIIDHIWGQGVIIIERNVDSHVSALRKKIPPVNDLIQSVRGLGYKFYYDKKKFAA